MGEPFIEKSRPAVPTVREGVYVVSLLAQDTNNLIVFKGPNRENKGKSERVQVIAPESSKHDCTIDWATLNMLCYMTELSGMEGEIVTGGVKEGERLMDAALRESKEERGLDPLKANLIYIPEIERNRVVVNQVRKGSPQSFRLYGFGSKLLAEDVSNLQQNYHLDVVNFSQLCQYLKDHKNEIRVSSLGILHNLLLNPHLFYYLAS